MAAAASSSASKPPPSPPRWSVEQQRVIDAAKAGKNVFFSGSAGTGKTHILQELITVFSYDENAHFTASTGAAAILIKGQTIHGFAGILTGAASKEELLKAIRGKGKNKNFITPLQRWEEADVLCVDEVSMLAGRALMDKLDYIGRKIRNNNEPFGGIQVIMTGDFLQLPPVEAENDLLFDAECFDRCFDEVVILTEVFRQKGDGVFIDILNNLRMGEIPVALEIKLLEAANRKLPDIHGVKATKLRATRLKTSTDNEEELNKLSTPMRVFRASIGGSSPPHREMMKKKCPAPFDLQIKEGAQVMLVKNLDTKAGLVNGSRGIVTKLEKGMNPEVCFENGVTIQIKPVTWEVKQRKKHGVEEVLASFTQYPLILAWVITIHKSQGITLDRAEVDCKGIFEYGQLYVAISRVKTLEGLSLLNYDRSYVKTNQRVVQWYADRLKKQQAKTLNQGAAAAGGKQQSMDTFIKTKAGEYDTMPPLEGSSHSSSSSAAAAVVPSVGDKRKTPSAPTVTTKKEPTDTTESAKRARFLQEQMRIASSIEWDD